MQIKRGGRMWGEGRARRPQAKRIERGVRRCAAALVVWLVSALAPAEADERKSPSRQPAATQTEAELSARAAGSTPDDAVRLAESAALLQLAQSFTSTPSPAALYASSSAQARRLRNAADRLSGEPALLAAAAPPQRSPEQSAPPPEAAAEEPASGRTTQAKAEADRSFHRRARTIHRLAASSAEALRTHVNAVAPSNDPARFQPGLREEPFGQGLNTAAEAVGVLPGLRLENVTLFTGYSSNAVPRNLVARGGSFELGSDTDFGGSATIAFQKEMRHGGFRLAYTPSHIQRLQISEWSQTNHVLQLSADRDLTPRWALQLDARGADSGVEQFWIDLPILREVELENPPANADEVFDQLLNGQITEDEAASLLTGAPVVDEPGRQRTDLQRVLSLSGAVRATYAYSPRWSFEFSGRSRSSQMRGDDLLADRPRIGAGLFLNRIESQSAAAAARYKLGPRTDVAFEQEATYFDSNFQDSTVHLSKMRFAQTFARWWRYEVHGGLGAITGLEALESQSFLNDGFSPGDPLGARLGWSAGGSLAYARSSHNLRMRFSRTAGGAMVGVGQAGSLIADGGWDWRPARSRWGLTTGLSYYRGLIDDRFFDGSGRGLETQLFRGGLLRRVSPSTSVRTEYFLGRYTSPFRGLLSNVSVHRAQASLIWSPVERR